MKFVVSILAAAVVFLGYRLVKIEGEMHQLQVNAAIAVLSAEAANNKVGAIAPFFGQDKEAFAKAWLDGVNMPLAVFPEDVLIPLKRTLEEKRNRKISQEQKAAIFK